jgi:hypothetical protein
MQQYYDGASWAGLSVIVLDCERDYIFIVAVDVEHFIKSLALLSRTYDNNLVVLSM